MSTNRQPDASPVRPEKRVRLVPHLNIAIAAQSMQLRSASRVTNLKGAMVERVLPHIFPLLDGTLTFAEVLERGAAKVGVGNARTLLDALVAKGFLEALDQPDERLFPLETAEQYETIARYFVATDRSGERYHSLSAIRAANVVLLDSGPLSCAVAAGLGHLGAGTITLCGDDATQRCQDIVPTKDDVAIVAAGRPASREEWTARLQQASFAVAVTRKPALFDEELQLLNEVAIATGTPWMTIALLGRVVQIGPLIHPGSSACLACLKLQYERNTSFLGAAGLTDRMRVPPSDDAELGPATDLVASLAVSEIARSHAVGQAPLSVAHILTIDAGTLAIDRFKVLKVPRCPACGPARDRPMMRIWG